MVERLFLYLDNALDDPSAFRLYATSDNFRAIAENSFRWAARLEDRAASSAP